MPDTWQTTRLWSLVRDKAAQEGNPAVHAVQTWMPAIETVLKSAGTVPLDFTLHDADHGFRVAERMVQLCPSRTLDKLGAYECALLLLAAYLHDIGMAPSRTV